MRFLVVGYYDRHNLGDDAFRVAIPRVVGAPHTYDFVSADSLQSRVARGDDPNAVYDAVLFGGGDVVLPYFFDAARAYLRRFTRGPIVLLGAGLTYPSCVALGHLDHFDRVVLRNTTDLRRAERRLGTEHAHYAPDLAFALEPAPQSPARGQHTLRGRFERGDGLKRPQAGVFLVQSIDRAEPDDAARQQRVLEQLAQCVAHVARTHDVTLVRFDTSGTRGNDDQHVSDTVAQLAAQHDAYHAVRIDPHAYRTPSAMLARMAAFDVHVCMRFHAHVFSVVQGVPFVSLALTRKVTMLVDELGLGDECAVRIEADAHSGQPLRVPVDAFRARFAHVVAHSDALRARLAQLYARRHALLTSGVYGRIVAQSRKRVGRRPEAVGAPPPPPPLLPALSAAGAVAAASDALESAVDAVQDAAQDAVDALGSAVDAAHDAAQDAAQDAVEDAVDALGSAVDAAQDAVQDAAEDVGDALGSAVDAAQDAADSAIDAAQYVAQDAANALAPLVDDAHDAVHDAVASTVDDAHAVAALAADAAHDATHTANATVHDAQHTIDPVVASAVDAVGNAVGYTVDSVDAMTDELVAKASRWWRHRFGYALDGAEGSAARARARSVHARSVLGAQSRALGGGGGGGGDRRSRALSLRQLRHARTVCERVCFAITHQVNSAYLHGFVDNMLRDPFRVADYVRWMIEDTRRRVAEHDDGARRFHLDYIRQADFDGSHRSGWAFAAEHLRALHSARGVLLDTCVDRTFHWGRDALEHAGVVPYTHSWCGILHHTPLESYTDYNASALVRSAAFQQSLLTCRGLYVLSASLKRWLDAALAECAAGVGRAVPVQVLSHPTELPPRAQRFSLRRFRANKQRALVNVGAWLRDTFALYELGLMDVAQRNAERAQRALAAPASVDAARTHHHARRRRRVRVRALPDPSVGYVSVPAGVGGCSSARRLRLRRAMLRGPAMDLYMPPATVHIHGCNGHYDDDDDEGSEASASCGAGGCRHECLCGAPHAGSAVQHCAYAAATGAHRGADEADDASASCGSPDVLGSEPFERRCANKWLAGLRRYVDADVRGVVELVDRLPSDAYDALLAQNIVFLRLYDASACNTLIECAARNTPVLVNRLPAVVELLGERYPLYYASLDEALAKSRSYAHIAAAHRYLARLDKTPHRVETFVAEIRNGAIYQSLEQ